MSNLTYRTERTGLLLVDPYNDFLSDGGKLFPMIKEVADDVRLLDNLRSIVAAARSASIRLFYVPHRRWQPGDYENWDHPNPTQKLVQKRQTFAKGTWGGEWHPDFVPHEGDIIIKEHWAQSGFANTDLDFHLKQQGITHIIVVGLRANTCIESTALCNGVGLSRHSCAGRDCRVHKGNDARCTQIERADVCTRDSHYSRSGRCPAKWRWSHLNKSGSAQQMP